MANIVCAANVDLTPAQVEESRLFKDYKKSLDSRWELGTFWVRWAFAVKGDIILMFAVASVFDELGNVMRVGITLRGETTEVLPLVVTPNNKRYVLFVRQPRAAVGAKLLSLPAGMNDGKSAVSTAVAELKEEVDLGFKWSEPLLLNVVVTGSEEPMFVSPGGSNEAAYFFYREAHISLDELEAIQGHTAGNAHENERTEVVPIPLECLPERLGEYGRVDLKAVTGILMYKYAVTIAATYLQ